MVALDDSAYVFIIALVLLIGLLIISNVFFPGVPGGGVQKIIASFQVGPVGSITGEPTVSKNLGNFIVGQTQPEVLKSFPQLLIQRGYFGETREDIEIEASEEFLRNVRGAKLEFTIADTNQYGNLTIEWNGRVVYNNRPAIGSLVVQVPMDAVKGENIVEIFAEPPGLFFWASTAYKIRNFQASIEYGPDKVVPFELSSDDVNSFSSGAITFGSQTNNQLAIRVNGNQIYHGIPSSINAVEFDLITTSLFPGVNVITFSAPESGVEVRNAKLDLFLNTMSAVKTTTFEIDQANDNAIRQGLRKLQLVYVVENIKRPGALQVRINNQRVQGVLSQVGENVVDIDQSMIIMGQNTIEFSATGTFTVSGADIVLV